MCQKQQDAPPHMKAKAGAATIVTMWRPSASSSSVSVFEPQPLSSPQPAET